MEPKPEPPARRRPEARPRAASEAEQAARCADSSVLSEAEKGELAAEASRNEDA
jgi:hypothetical protein